MSASVPFQPGAANNTKNIVVGTASANVSLNNGVFGQARFVNSGPNIIYIDVATASAPTSVATTSMPMLPNTVEVLSVPQYAIISAISAATGNTLYLTAGEGL